MYLVLFDIDGTLLHSNGAGRQALERALSQCCNHPIDTTAITFSGKTDPQILCELLQAHGIATDDASLVEAMLQTYAATAKEAFTPNTVDALPGASTLVETLAAREDVQLGLLTGNIEPMAYRKLAAIGLDHHFAFGAFGSDHANRNRLPPIALHRARTHTGHPFSGADTVIIGDTAHDIRCGQSIGARSVAVCTGRYDRNELAQHQPDVLLNDLTDTGGFLDALSAHAS